MTASTYPIYCFGYFNEDLYPRPLVMDKGWTIWRPATQQEFIDHHDEMVNAILVERVTSFTRKELVKMLDAQTRIEAMERANNVHEAPIQKP